MTEPDLAATLEECFRREWPVLVQAVARRGVRVAPYYWAGFQVMGDTRPVKRAR